MQLRKISTKSLDLIFLFSIDFLLKASKFLLVPLFATILTATEYGKLEYYSAFLMLFSAFLGPGLFNWIIKNENTVNKKLATETTYFLAKVLTPLLALSAVVSYITGTYFILALPVYAFFHATFYLFAAMHKFNKQIFTYLIAALLIIFLDYAFIYIIYYSGVVSSEMRYIAPLLSFLLASLFLLCRLPMSELQVSTPIETKSFARYFFPYICFGLSSFASLGYAKIIIAENISFERLASMGIALQIIAVLKMSADAIVKNTIALSPPKSDSAKIDLRPYIRFLALLTLLYAIITSPELSLWLPNFGYEFLWIDFYNFLPSRVIMVSNLYLFLLFTSNSNGKIVIATSLFTIATYVILCPWVVISFGVSGIAYFDLVINVILSIFYLLYAVKSSVVNNVNKSLIIILYGIIITWST